MKKLLICLMGVGIIGNSVAKSIEGWAKQKVCNAKKLCKTTINEDKAKRYKQYAIDYEKKAEKAEKRGEKELAEVLKECAAAKRKIAKGYAEGNRKLISEGYADYRVACKKRDKINSVKYEEYAKQYEKKAEKAEKAGNKTLAEAYRKCAAAKRKIAEGMANGDRKKKQEGYAEYKDAYKAMREAKKKNKD